MTKYYTLGEIFRGGMLLNHLGLPYTNKSSISRIADKIGTKEKKTAFGIAKVLSQKQINDWNNHWK